MNINKEKAKTILIIVLSIIILIRIGYIAVTAIKEKEELEAVTHDAGEQIEQIYKDYVYKGMELKCIETYKDTDTKEYVSNMCLYIDPIVELFITDDPAKADHAVWLQMQYELYCSAQILKAKMNPTTDFVFGIKLYKKDDTLLLWTDEKGKAHYIFGEEFYNYHPTYSEQQQQEDLGGGIEYVEGPAVSSTRRYLNIIEYHD